MKKQDLYRVTVYGTYSKDVLVYADSEDDALDYVQDICDSTDLIKFTEDDQIELEAEDAINLEDNSCGHDCSTCPVFGCKPTGECGLQTDRKPEPHDAPVLHIPTQDLRMKPASQQDSGTDKKKSDSEYTKHVLSEAIDFLCITGDVLDDLLDFMYALYDDTCQQDDK